MRKVVFTSDFATKLKGDTFECDGQLASQLVHGDKVAKYADIKEDDSDADDAKEDKKEKKKKDK